MRGMAREYAAGNSSRTGLARVCGDLRLSGGWVGRRRCRQAGSGMARSRAKARLNFSAQGQRSGRCRVNRRAEREQWIKEGKYALNWTRLSCHKFVANQVRLWLFILAYNLGNFFRRLALPEAIKSWSLTSIQTRLIKIGGRLVRHARRLVFQLAEVMVTREMFDEMLERIGRLRFNPG